MLLGAVAFAFEEDFFTEENAEVEELEDVERVLVNRFCSEFLGVTGTLPKSERVGSSRRGVRLEADTEVGSSRRLRLSTGFSFVWMHSIDSNGGNGLGELRFNVRGDFADGRTFEFG